MVDEGDGDDDVDDDWRYLAALPVGRRPGTRGRDLPVPTGVCYRSGKRRHTTCCDGEIGTQD
jgi:hypothetical protein